MVAFFQYKPKPSDLDVKNNACLALIIQIM